ncbi:hypothetical protein [Neptunomonas sp.]|uniref:hypothetical protein n=1 Tax=Neptunomonas sp. TaxID=1971898 RepID=UPI003562BCE1
MITRIKSIAGMSGRAVSAGIILISLAATASAEITAGGASTRVFPIQSFSTGSSADVWVIRTDSSIEYCRSEATGSTKGATKGSQNKGAAIQCYGRDQPNKLRFASVEAIISSDPAIASAYAMTSSGQLVYCRVRGDSKQSKKPQVRCHL